LISGIQKRAKQCSWQVSQAAADIHCNIAAAGDSAVAKFDLAAYVALRVRHIDWLVRTLRVALATHVIKEKIGR